jgi:FtsH-binding integral membrane protein
MTVPSTLPTTIRPVDTEVQHRLTMVTRLWLACGLVSGAGLAVTTVLAMVDPADVTWVVWLRGSVVAVASFVLMAVTAAAARGNRSAYVRLRWISILAPIGIVAILLAPDAGYPLWMKVEQGIVGVLIVLIAIQLNGRTMRKAFPRGSTRRAAQR